MKKHIPEIVAPWGSYEKAMVAAQYWADAVYVWVPFTSLRMRQNKLKTFDELKKTIDDLHKLKVKAYLTMNIFPRNQDIKIFESVVKKIAKLGADGIIFSDPGTYNIIRKHLPKMSLHLSTQASTLNYQSAKFWYDLWVRRVVLARELHIDEIKEIKKKLPKMELEVFVHWAMCMSYSGRCLLGDYMAGRPWNKWECVHSCRFKYKLRLEEERRPGKLFQIENNEDWAHILSSKDLCTINKQDKILPYVDALKIEGRSKSEFYVWAVVKAYKHVRDCLILWKKPDKNIVNLVNAIPHREYRDWFLFNKLSEFPEWEGKAEGEWSTTITSAGPLFNRNYFWVFTDKSITKDKKTYYQIDPKEVLTKWMEIKFLSPDSMWVLKILDILDSKWKPIEKATCNTHNIYVLTDKKLKGREILYS